MTNSTEENQAFTSKGTANAEMLTLDDIRDRATISIDETAAVLGVSRASAYASARIGAAFPVKRIGRRLLVPVPALLAWLSEN